MKKTAISIAAAVLGFAAISSANAAEGYYEEVGQGNNPFVFCTTGQPSHGWVGVNPATGAWAPIRKKVNPRWIGAYTRACPQGVSTSAVNAANTEVANNVGGPVSAQGQVDSAAIP